MTTSPFEVLDRTLTQAGPAAAIDALIAQIDGAADHRALLDALLLKARHELGLPLIPLSSLAGLTEPARTRFEERYVDAIRQVGSKLLAAGEIPAAWSYFRAIGEPEPVTSALDRFVAPEDPELVGRIIDVAFQQGANPLRGFELILDHYGTCSAITALEQAPPADPSVQADCIGRLVRHLHRELHANLTADLAGRGLDVTPGPSLLGLIDGRDEIFADQAYHVDVSHLGAAVRYSILVSDPELLGLAVDLAEYGRRLSPRLQFEGAPPFERTFEDHRLYLKALLGDDPQPAIDLLRSKLQPDAPDDLDSTIPAQLLVNLLTRIGRHDEALDVATEFLASIAPEALSCPGLPELCRRAGRMDRLASLSQRLGNPVMYLVSRLQPESLPA
ncbi:hypothetical protein [Aquisphaera insulae]|uniref:hypothetical protein n=1 Tax=Aquisphaera insulae TaxID=2712864 RepID=UPI0013EC3926|nr:hypothetical protein [Aquisphaera insulae]